jgi:exopolysaccharide biosynthesis protein
MANHIVNQRNFKKNKEIEFAIQSGPRLVVNGKIPLSLKPGMDSRTALGITKNNDIILVATENLRLTTTQLASVMLAFQIDGGLGCVDALNLDGGSSTQLYASFKNFYLDIAGYSAVTDAIIVVPR